MIGHDPTHHAKKCVKRGMNDLGHEGVVLFKRDGKYYLGAADDYEGRYSTCLAMSDHIYGPYKKRHESIPVWRRHRDSSKIRREIGGVVISVMIRSRISERK